MTGILAFPTTTGERLPDWELVECPVRRCGPGVRVDDRLLRQATAIDAALAEFHATVIEDGCCGVGLQSNDIQAALAAMRQVSVVIGTSMRSGQG